MTPSDRDKVLIIEERTSGHLLVYVRIIAKQALELGRSVVLGLPRSTLSSVEYAAHLSELGRDVTIIEIPSRLRPADVSALARRAEASTVIIPHGDTIAAELSFGPRIRGFKLVLLIMRDPRWERPAPIRRHLKNLLKLASIKVTEAKRNIRVVWLREPSYVPRERECFAIDPFIADGTVAEVEEGALSMRAALGLDEKTFWFGVTGAISARKNVPMIVEALKLVRTRSDRPIGFALIGPIQETAGFSESIIAANCAGSDIAFVAENRVLRNFEMNCAVRAFDCVVMAYDTHSPNSTLGKAYVLGTRLVAAGPPSIRRFVRELGFGFDSPLGASALAGSLEQALSTERPEQHPGGLSEAAFAQSLLDDGCHRL